MPLFKTGECCICGKELGIIGKVKLADGLLCGKCSGKMSPFVHGKKKMTKADVEKHLAYREENKKTLAAFNPDFIRGCKEKIYAESKTGRFVVTDASDWRAANPDVITRLMLNAVDIEVEEDETEIKMKLEDGTYESYDPKQYEYEYTFNAHMYVKHPWFSEIKFEFSDPSARPDQANGPAFNECVYVGREIQHVLMPNKYGDPGAAPAAPEPAAPATGEWTCECGQVNSSNFCSACGKPRPVRWFCPDCGVENHGAFCTNCGRKKPL